jgi:hypothetical protein
MRSIPNSGIADGDETMDISTFPVRRFGELPNPSRLYSYSAFGKRGWILQEIILSRRIIHFVDGQILWQCDTRIETEDGNYEQHNENVKAFHSAWGPLQSLLPAKGKDFTNMWWSTIREYSRRQLTYPTDSLAAFGGITEFFSAISGG